MKIIVIVDKHSDGTMTVDIRDKSKVAAYFMKHPEGRHFLEFEDVQEPEECKSWEQCKYYWGVIIKAFTEYLIEVGNCLPLDKEQQKIEASNAIKEVVKFTTKQAMTDGTFKIIPRSIKGLGKDAMSLFIQECYNFLNVELHLNIESSQDHYDRLRHEQEQRNKFINIIKNK